MMVKYMREADRSIEHELRAAATREHRLKRPAIKGTDVPSAS